MRMLLLLAVLNHCPLAAAEVAAARFTSSHVRVEVAKTPSGARFALTAPSATWTPTDQPPAARFQIKALGGTGCPDLGDAIFADNFE